jgi:hypothetical protein
MVPDHGNLVNDIKVGEIIAEGAASEEVAASFKGDLATGQTLRNRASYLLNPSIPASIRKRGAKVRVLGIFSRFPTPTSQHSHAHKSAFFQKKRRLRIIPKRELSNDAIHVAI